MLALDLSLESAAWLAPAFNPLSLFAAGAAGGWYDPSDISTLWQDSARTIPVTAHGDPVGAIDDKSGNGNHLIQATAGFRPLYQVAGALKYLMFDGVDDRLSAASFTFADASGFNSQVLGISFDAATGVETAISISDAAGTPKRQDIRKNVATLENLILNTAGAASTDTGPTVSAGVACVFSATLGSGNLLDARKDGVSDGATAASGSLNTGAVPLYLGCRNNAADFVNGNIYAAIWLSREPTATELSDMEAWAAARAGVTL